MFGDCASALNNPEYQDINKRKDAVESITVFEKKRGGGGAKFSAGSTLSQRIGGFIAQKGTRSFE